MKFYNREKELEVLKKADKLKITKVNNDNVNR